MSAVMPQKASVHSSPRIQGLMNTASPVFNVDKYQKMKFLLQFFQINPPL